MPTYYRASFYPTIGADCGRHCLAERREDAEAYLGDGGLGGDRLWQIDLEFADGELLDLGDSVPEAMERLHEALAACGVDVEAIRWAEYNWPYELLFSSHSFWEELRAAGYVAVRFPDEYPAGAVTVAYLGDDIEMAEAGVDQHAYEDRVKAAVAAERDPACAALVERLLVDARQNGWRCRLESAATGSLYFKLLRGRDAITVRVSDHPSSCRNSAFSLLYTGSAGDYDHSYGEVRQRLEAARR